MIRIDTALGYAILGLLGQEPRAGYDLRKIFTATPFSHFSDSPGAVYPALRRLQRKGWVTASHPEGGRRRRLFRLSATGRKAWLAWLKRPPSAAEVVWSMDALMVRFAFMGEALPASAAVRFLDAFVVHVEAHVDELRRFREGVAADLSATGRLAFDAGIEAFEARAAWARRARAVVARKGGFP